MIWVVFVFKICGVCVYYLFGIYKVFSNKWGVFKMCCMNGEIVIFFNDIGDVIGNCKFYIYFFV